MRAGATLLEDRDEPVGESPSRLLAEPDRLSGALAVAFGCAAAIGAAVRLSNQYAHGWWLVAYLLLVGAVAQLLVAPGGTWVARRLGAPTPLERHRWWGLGLWNLGTVLVPIGVFTDRASPVLAGSALLLASLALYLTGMRGAAHASPERSHGWERGYYAVLVGLAGSVFVGAVLAGALPFP